jgi:hypothetical protein
MTNTKESKQPDPIMAAYAAGISPTGPTREEFLESIRPKPEPAKKRKAARRKKPRAARRQGR